MYRSDLFSFFLHFSSPILTHSCAYLIFSNNFRWYLSSPLLGRVTHGPGFIWKSKILNKLLCLLFILSVMSSMSSFVFPVSLCFHLCFFFNLSLYLSDFLYPSHFSFILPFIQTSVILHKYIPHFPTFLEKINL